MVIQDENEFDSSEVLAIIAAEPDGLHFYLFWDSTDSENSASLEMVYSEDLQYVYVYTTYTLGRGTSSSEAEVDILNYYPERDYVEFYHNRNTTSLSSSRLSEIMNALFDLSVYCWDDLLNDELGMNVAELGFSNFCDDHSSEEWITEAPTCTDDGEAEYICNNCGLIMDTIVLPATGAHSYISETTPATTSRNGKTVTVCSVCGDVKSTTTIYKIETVKLEKTAYSYDGTAKKPKVIIKDAKGKTINSKYYTVKYPKGCTNVGTYKVTVTFKGLYNGNASCTFKVVPGRVTDLRAVSKNPGTAKLTWSEAVGAKKYVIYCSLNGKNGFKKIGSTAKTSCNVKGLASGTMYYFCVKSYTKVSGSSYFGTKSNIAKVRSK